MLKTMVVTQIVLIVLVVGFGTYHLFRGNFELAFGTLPFLFVYYVFVTVRQKRRTSRQGSEAPDE